MKRLLLLAAFALSLISCSKESIAVSSLKGYWMSESSVSTINSNKKGVPNTPAYRLFYLDGKNGGKYYGTVFDNRDAYQYYTNGGPKITKVITDKYGTNWYCVSSVTPTDLEYTVEDDQMIATNGKTVLCIDIVKGQLDGYKKVK